MNISKYIKDKVDSFKQARYEKEKGKLRQQIIKMEEERQRKSTMEKLSENKIKLQGQIERSNAVIEKAKGPNHLMNFAKGLSNSVNKVNTSANKGVSTQKFSRKPFENNSQQVQQAMPQEQVRSSPTDFKAGREEISNPSRPFDVKVRRIF